MSYLLESDFRDRVLSHKRSNLKPEAPMPTIEEGLKQSPNLLRPPRQSEPLGPQHVLQSQQFTRPLLAELFYLADRLQTELYPCMQGKLCNFYTDERTTRTRSSTAAAVRRLGGVCEFYSAGDTSEGKGEPLDRTLRALIANGADIIAIRYKDEHAIYRAATVSTVPIINAGTGTGQHPTQTLTDLYTIFKKCGRLDNLKIAIVGDLVLSRVVHSLLYGLSKFEGNEIFLVSPDHLRIRGDLRFYLFDNGISVQETAELDWVLPQVDVVYQTRAQKERTEDPKLHNGLSSYVMSRSIVAKMREGAGIMHPLPANEELPQEIAGLPQNWFDYQMECGQHIRTALFAKIFTPPAR